MRRRTFLGAALLLVPLAGCAQQTPAATEPPVDPTPGRFTELERRFGARLGVYAVHTGTGQEVLHRADERFPMCSTSKVLAAGAQLAGPPEHLDVRIRYTAADLLEYAPVTTQHVAEGMTVAELCDAALRYSDNTAMNLLLTDLGGPGAITAFARTLGDGVTRLDRPEPELNTAIPGDERDTSTPRALAGSLRELALGSRLQPAMRTRLNDWMLGNTTGAQSIRAGIPATWRVGDKTGSGSYGTVDDIAVVYPPTGAPIVLATLSTLPSPEAQGDKAVLAGAAAIVADVLA